MKVIILKFKEVVFSILPISLIVLLLNFTITPLPTELIMVFFLSAFLLVLGLTIFLFGIDIGISPLGELTGTTIAKTGKIYIVLISGLILGFFISAAEPSLMVLSYQVDMVTSGIINYITMIVVVSLGLAVMLSLGFLRIFYNIPLVKILLPVYAFILIMGRLVSREFLAIAFDSSGSTTGILAVPFILALSVGISKLKKDSKASEKDSFGLIAIASTGPIISVIFMGILYGGDAFAHTSHIEVFSEPTSMLYSFIYSFVDVFFDSLLAILPMFVFFIILNYFFIDLSKNQVRRIKMGFLFSFVGLLLFLWGVNLGFMDAGKMIGESLALLDNKIYIVIFGFVLGATTILAEPAVYILTQQIEAVTSGSIKKITVLIPLTIGVGIAVSLSVLRVLIPSIQLWHYLYPGYLLCLVLMFFSPKVFVGIAYDAGGVATGPMTATFILAFIQGAANAFDGADLLIDGFGMIAMVAMVPIITLQILGIVFKIRNERR